MLPETYMYVDIIQGEVGDCYLRYRCCIGEIDECRCMVHGCDVSRGRPLNLVDEKNIKSKITMNDDDYKN